MFGDCFPETAFAAGHALAKAVFDCARLIADYVTTDLRRKRLDES
jgi:hypothetical protein